MQRRYQWVLLVGTTVLFLDQTTKYLVGQTLRLNQVTTVVPGFFNLVHVLNKGAAFGFLNRSDIQWQTYFFIATSIVAVVLIFNMLRSMEHDTDRIMLLALGLILGGALGNLVDRVRIGFVVDFLEFYLGSFYWPAFNVADIAISVGAFGVLAAFYRQRKPSAE